MNDTLDKLELAQANRPLEFDVGDTVKVHYKITEGNKERIQLFEGVVIAIRGGGATKSFVVRRISFDVGVERIFPLYAPTVEKIEKVRSGKVRRAKLYYLREKEGKAARLKEIKRQAKADKVFAKAEEIRKELAAKAASVAKEAEPAAEEATENTQEQPA